MNREILRKSRLYLKKYSPLFLTCVASIGVIATAVTAVKATPQAVELIKSDSKKNHDDPDAYTKTEAIISAWKCYIPAVIIGASTIACIFGANALNKRQQASLASAYALVSNSYREYKEKLKDLYGEDAHKQIIDTMIKDKCKETYIHCGGYCLKFEEGFEPETKRTFYDNFSKRCFESTIGRVIEAEYHLNRNLMLMGEVTLNDFYEFLGLEKTEYGASLGWSICDELMWIDFDHHKTTLDDGLEIFVIDMIYEPRADYWDIPV